jgi:serine/threonine-protein kinase
MFKSMQDKVNNDQLINEIQGLSRARSRHVVEIYDVIQSQDGSVQGIIIEYLSGEGYEDFHLTAKSDANAYLKTLYQIACALNDLHAAGITHRDLKLGNIKNSSSQVLKVFDFGISASGVDYRTKTNRGTLVYAAPELYVANAVITPGMDIYAFGICAWALASDTYPPELLERPPQKTNRGPSIERALPKLLHPEIVQIIDACLSPSPEHRPTAETLRKIFARHLTVGKHKGLFSQGQEAVFELSHSKSNVNIRIGPLGSLKADYDGLNFIITSVSGNIYVNNSPAIVGMTLHESCVLTFGNIDLGSKRQWVTFTSSQPEVIL